MPKPYKNIFLSGALMLILLLSLGLIVYLQQKIFNFSNQDTNGTAITVTNLNYDPFVITVPKEYVALHARSKIFINTVDPYQGNLSAPVVLVSFLSFNQAESQAAYQALSQLQEKYPEQVVWFWKDYPVNDAAKNMAITAQCAADYDNKFWDTVQELYGAESAAAEEKYQSCLAAGEMSDIVNSNYYYGRSLEITNAPTIYINDQPVTAELTLENLEQIIQNEINPKN